MSTTEPPHRFDHISICSSASINSDDEFIEYLCKIKEIPLPDEFKNRVVDIQPDDVGESEIYFGESGNSDPREAEENIQVDKLNDDELHVHTEFSSDKIDAIVSILEEITEIIGSIEINTVHTRGDTLIDFESLDLPLDFDHPARPNGVRFLYDDDIHLIQKANPDHVETALEDSEEDIDEDLLFWRTEHRLEKEMTSSEVKNFIDEFIEGIRETQADIADHEVE